MGSEPLNLSNNHRISSSGKAGSTQKLTNEQLKIIFNNNKINVIPGRSASPRAGFLSIPIAISNEKITKPFEGKLMLHLNNYQDQKLKFTQTNGDLTQIGEIEFKDLPEKLQIEIDNFVVTNTKPKPQNELPVSLFRQNPFSDRENNITAKQVESAPVLSEGQQRIFNLFSNAAGLNFNGQISQYSKDMGAYVEQASQMLLKTETGESVVFGVSFNKDNHGMYNICRIEGGDELDLGYHLVEFTKDQLPDNFHNAYRNALKGEILGYRQN